MQLFRKTSVVFIILSVLGLLLYFPILNNEFLSDDFLSLHRIIIEKRILYREFLRPLMDVSFYLNYLISGLDPWSYYALNLAIHILNAFLLFRLASRIRVFNGERQFAFAFISSLLFLLYPFHNEGVVWLTGRLASMASFAALLILNIWMSQQKQGLKLFLCLLIYFIGLLAYESILLLPLIVALWCMDYPVIRRSNFRRLMWAVLIIVFALALRFIVSGAVYGDYGARMVLADWNVYADRVFKTLGRSILPPSENSAFLQGAFVLVFIAFFFVHFLALRKLRSANDIRFNYSRILAGFVIAIFLPMLFGISTRTSEGDRLLYFPSIFICLLLSFWGLTLFQKWSRAIVWFWLTGAYFLFFLLLNNRHWETASKSLLQIKEATQLTRSGTVCLINLPDEVEGAYIFRNGFREFLQLRKINAEKVIVISTLKRLDYLKIDSVITPKFYEASTAVPPFAVIKQSGGVLTIHNVEDGSVYRGSRAGTFVFYWNKYDLKRLN